LLLFGVATNNQRFKDGSKWAVGERPRPKLPFSIVFEQPFFLEIPNNGK
jgi:hypothetical protein